MFLKDNFPMLMVDVVFEKLQSTQSTISFTTYLEKQEKKKLLGKGNNEN